MNRLWLPGAASGYASEVDVLFYAVLTTTVLVAVVITVMIGWFSFRYRAGSPAPRAIADARRERSFRVALEVFWIGIPLLLFLGAFAWAAELYVVRSLPPPGAMDVFVVAKQWMWKVQHSGGQREINELHVPTGRPVRLTMTSEDVIHSFYVPAFRVKQDVLPGRYTTLWFDADRAGTYHLFCAEYCGTDHARMGGRVVALAPADYARWLAEQGSPMTMAARGEALFRQFGCSGCHGANSTVPAPKLDGVFGRPVPLSDGSVVIADERYIRDSILTPAKQVAAGYAPIMPSFAGRISEEDVGDLVAYLKQLGAEKGKP
jgi:cytochrome c oxidase subunit 2